MLLRVKQQYKHIAFKLNNSVFQLWHNDLILSSTSEIRQNFLRFQAINLQALHHQEKWIFYSSSQNFQLFEKYEDYSSMHLSTFQAVA